MINRRAFLTNIGFGVGGLVLAGGVYSKRDDIIHGALLRHPEWLQEQASILQKRQAKAMVDAHRDELFHDARDPILGHVEPGPGVVTIIELVDPQCPYCKEMTPVMRELYETDKSVRLAIKMFPFLGPASKTASQIGYAAQIQGKFEPWYNAMMADDTKENKISDDRLFGIAASAGTDIEKLKRDMTKPEIEKQITDNQQLAAQLVSGTPWIVIGDTIFTGATSIGDLRKAVANARSANVSPTSHAPGLGW